MEKILFYIIIGLVCLLVVFIFLSGNLPALNERKELIPESLIKITGEPLISYSKNDNYKYTITIPAEIEYTGKWELDKKEIDSVDVVSRIRFKGFSENASIDGKDTFSLTKINPRFEGELSAVVESDAGPIKKIGNSYDGKMKMHESFLITTDDGNFAVTLESIDDDPCKAKFAIECETDKRYIELVDWILCEEGSARYPREYNKCERYVEICDGTVHIRLMGPTICEEKEIGSILVDTDRVIISAEKGKPFEPGERVEVSFWRKSDCIEEKNKFDELLSNCVRDFLGYSFMKGVIVV